MTKEEKKYIQFRMEKQLTVRNVKFFDLFYGFRIECDSNSISVRALRTLKINGRTVKM